MRMKDLKYPSLTVGALKNLLENSGVTDDTALFFHDSEGENGGEWPFCAVYATIIETGELLDNDNAVVLHCRPLYQPPHYMELKKKLTDK